jgi:hypothetical protein
MSTSTMPEYSDLTPPAEGESITMKDGTLHVPDQPIIPFIEGDGTGPDIWRAAQMVFDGAVRKAYGATRRLVWFEVLAGEKAKRRSPRPWAAGSGRSTWRSASSSTCTPACGRFAGSRAFPRP